MQLNGADMALAWLMLHLLSLCLLALNLLSMSLLSIPIHLILFAHLLLFVLSSLHHFHITSLTLSCISLALLVHDVLGLQGVRQSRKRMVRVRGRRVCIVWRGLMMYRLIVLRQFRKSWEIVAGRGS